MIDDQAKETILIYARGQTAFPQELSFSSSENINDLSLILTSSTPDMPNPVQNNSNHQIQVGDAVWIRFCGSLDEGEVKD